MKNKIPAWIVLTVITLCAGLLLGVTNEMTADKIALQNELSAGQARQSAFRTAEKFEALEVGESGLDNCYAAYDGAGALLGHVGQATVNGFGSPIEVVVGVNLSGEITGISVGGANFAETAGLGSKTRDAAFTAQFVGLRASGDLVLKSDVDSVTGASISSGAVVSGVNQVCEFIMTLN